MAEGEYRCFVGGLAWVTDDRALEDAFRSYGRVTDSKVISDRETGRSRGFGFVTFEDEQSMLDAIEGMNGKELDGRSITVNQAQSRSGGGGGGGGGYRRSEGRYGGGGGGYDGERKGYEGGGGRSGGGYGGGGGGQRYSSGYGEGDYNAGGGGGGGGSRWRN